MRIAILVTIAASIIVLETDISLGISDNDFEQLLGRVKDIEDREQRYMSTIEKLQATLNDQEQRIQKLEDEAVLKDTVIDELQQQLSLFKHKNQVPATQSENKKDRFNIVGIDRYNEHERNNTLSIKVAKPVKGINEDNKTRQKSLESTRNRRLQINSHQVAFHAVADANQAHLGIGQNIAFETVLLNLGNGYHNQHGVFIAPTGGIYVFSVSILNEVISGHETIDVSLMKNGQRLSNAIADGRNSYYGQGSTTVTTQLQEGDEVWVEVYYPDTDAYYHGNRFSSFTGFLLFVL